MPFLFSCLYAALPRIRVAFDARHLLIVSAVLATGGNAWAAVCSATSGPAVTPVIELFTSEGCSSCPPADKWISTLKNDSAVVQAFHVGYWDYIGWVDRFAAPAHTVRQREIAARNSLRSIYTPQAVLDGQDWPNWKSGQSGQSGQSRQSARLTPATNENAQPAPIAIAVTQSGPDQFEAVVTPAADSTRPQVWSAYWTVTEHGHQSNIRSGENAGELLKHDFVVRQYTVAGDYRTDAAVAVQKLAFRSIAATPEHERQINLVVFDKKTGATLQALSLRCAMPTP